MSIKVVVERGSKFDVPDVVKCGGAELGSYSHYFKDVRGIDSIDVYRVIKLFNVTDPCIQHAVKKLLVAGGRGGKNVERDLLEAADSINRALQMMAEDSARDVALD